VEVEHGFIVGLGVRDLVVAAAYRKRGLSAISGLLS
jgi:hypothetical protein